MCAQRQRARFAKVGLYVYAYAFDVSTYVRSFITLVSSGTMLWANKEAYLAINAWLCVDFCLRAFAYVQTNGAKETARSPTWKFFEEKPSKPSPPCNPCLEWLSRMQVSSAYVRKINSHSVVMWSFLAYVIDT